MLVLTRKLDESVLVDSIEITLIRVTHDSCYLEVDGKLVRLPHGTSVTVAGAQVSCEPRRGHNAVRIAFEAPPSVQIYRKELRSARSSTTTGA